MTKSHIPILTLSLLVLSGCKQSPSQHLDDVEGISEPNESLAQINERSRNNAYPQILSESLNEVELIHNPWESRFILHLKDKLVQFIKPLDTVRFLVVSRGGESMTHYLTDANIDGTINHELEINEPNWFIDKQTNFIQIDKDIHFYLKGDSTEWIYSLNGRVIKTTKKLLDWSRIEGLDWLSGQDEISHSGSHNMTFNGGTDLVLQDLNSGMSVEFIKQSYLGNWAFGTGCWSDDDAKFYFDNSGPIACIWELDVMNRTLDKIVPEHHAAKPNYISGTKHPTIIYHDEGYIKTVTRRDVLTSTF